MLPAELIRDKYINLDQNSNSYVMHTFQSDFLPGGSNESVLIDHGASVSNNGEEYCKHEGPVTPCRQVTDIVHDDNARMTSVATCANKSRDDLNGTRHGVCQSTCAHYVH